MIDTEPSYAGGTIAEFGEDNIATYGQTFIVPAGVTSLDSFTFYLRHNSGSTNHRFAAYVAAWSGDRIVGPLLYDSGLRTLTLTAGSQSVVVNTGGVTVTPGQTYVIFLSASNYFDGIGDLSRWDRIVSDAAYAGGTFVFNNNGNNFSALSSSAWTVGFFGDLRFRAEFSAGDSTPPTLTISGPVAAQTARFTVNFNFSESVVGFTSGDVVVTNGTLSGFTGSGASYSATVTPTGDGLVSLNVAAAAYEDAAGNDNTTASSFSVLADISLPTVSVAGPTGPVNAPFTVNFVFSENVSNFALGDITVINGTASAFAGSGANYSATITPTTNGPVQVSLANGVANDAAGNGNQISNAFSVIADLTAPVVTVPGNISVGTDSGLNTAVVTYSVSANDPGNGALTPVLTAGLASGSTFPLGTTLVTYQATDAAGNVREALI